MMGTRRAFLATSAVLTAGVVSQMSLSPVEIMSKKPLAHHVFFWLKNPNSKEDLDKLIKGLRTLARIETIRELHIGVPASTEVRPVIDGTYSASELMFFDDLDGQKIYQDHPIHQKFITDCSHLWEKVLVYDAQDV